MVVVIKVLMEVCGLREFRVRNLCFVVICITILYLFIVSMKKQMGKLQFQVGLLCRILVMEPDSMGFGLLINPLLGHLSGEIKTGMEKWKSQNMKQYRIKLEWEM